uniref:Hydroquinone glucosyltransferase n=1 Tax=Aegilops tauschii subsp. strangulata TaxID=200361 RepID=A0A453T438_AEGTS
MIDLGRNYLLAEGFIVNTMDALEHETLVAYKELSNKGVYPPAYAVGPFTRRWCPDSDEVNHSCLRWLDNQPDGSVLYVSFGSGGTLSTAQTAEQRMNAVMLSSDRVGLAIRKSISTPELICTRADEKDQDKYYKNSKNSNFFVW